MPVPTQFDDVLFPVDVAVTETGGYGWRTGVEKSYSGDEQRNQSWANPLGRWTVDYGNTTLAKVQIAAQFAVGRRGKGRSFRFFDPRNHRHDYELADSPDTIQADASFYVPSGTGVGAAIFYTAAGGETAVQLAKPGGDLANPHYMPITKPVDETVYTGITLYDGTVIATPTWTLYQEVAAVWSALAHPADYAIEFNSGEISGLTALGAGDRLAYIGWHHTHARLDVDDAAIQSILRYTSAARVIDSAIWPSIPIQGLRG
ncbi:MAG TPA: DUF2460 domain-containing protein [Phycisphaerae bacterium]|nr:DUF2460 domain-containing protein [Phycisphaerae bacterium]